MFGIIYSLHGDVPQKVIVGDISKLADVCEAVKGVDYVIHTCSYVSIETFPDATGMEMINVDGTQKKILVI